MSNYNLRDYWTDLCFNSLWRPSTHPRWGARLPMGTTVRGRTVVRRIILSTSVLVPGLLWCLAEVKCALIKWYFTLEELVSDAWPDGDVLNNTDAQLVVFNATLLRWLSAQLMSGVQMHEWKIKKINKNRNIKGPLYFYNIYFKRICVETSHVWWCDFA